MRSTEILEMVLDALRATNEARHPEEQLVVAGDAPIFGPASPLDSLGLVAFLIDVEERLEARGCPLTFTDAAALSQRRSPFRDVPSLVAYIERRLVEDVACPTAAS